MGVLVLVCWCFDGVVFSFFLLVGWWCGVGCGDLFWSVLLVVVWWEDSCCSGSVDEVFV